MAVNVVGNLVSAAVIYLLLAGFGYLSRRPDLVILAATVLAFWLAMFLNKKIVSVVMTVIFALVAVSVATAGIIRILSDHPKRFIGGPMALVMAVGFAAVAYVLWKKRHEDW